MAINPNIYLKEPKSEQSLIYLAVRINKNELFKYSTGLKMPPELFDKINKRPVKDTKLINEYAKILPKIKDNLKLVEVTLNNLVLDTSKLINDQLRYDKSISAIELKKSLDEVYNKHRVSDKKPKQTTLNNYLVDFIERMECGKLLHSGKVYTKGTIKTYKTFQNILNAYHAKIEFDTVDLIFYDKFIQYLNQKNYTLNSVGKNIKFLKVVMQGAFDEGLHKNTAFKHKDFKTLHEKADAVYLTESELDMLYNIDLSNKPNYELARDIFLVGCYFALRYSDYSRINKDFIKSRNGVNYLEMYTQKTNELVKIPIKPRVYDILKKYDFNLPKTYEQKLNKYIKEVCKLLNIDENIEIIQTIGGVVKTTFKPKYAMVKTHTARRTGATLLYLAEVPPIDIMKITGHKTIISLLKYICVTKEQTAERLAKNAFFS